MFAPPEEFQDTGAKLERESSSIPLTRKDDIESEQSDAAAGVDDMVYLDARVGYDTRTSFPVDTICSVRTLVDSSSEHLSDIEAVSEYDATAPEQSLAQSTLEKQVSDRKEKHVPPKSEIILPKVFDITLSEAKTACGDMSSSASTKLTKPLTPEPAFSKPASGLKPKVKPVTLSDDPKTSNVDRKSSAEGEHHLEGQRIEAIDRKYTFQCYSSRSTDGKVKVVVKTVYGTDSSCKTSSVSESAQSRADYKKNEDSCTETIFKHSGAASFSASEQSTSKKSTESRASSRTVSHVERKRSKSACDSRRTAYPERAVTSSEGRRRVERELSLADLGFDLSSPIIHEVVNVPNKTAIFGIIYKRILEREEPDYILFLQEDEVPCHHIVLSCYTLQFNRTPSIRSVRLPHKDIQLGILKLIYDWMTLSNEASARLFSKDNVLRIFRGARVMGVKQLEEQCWAYMDSNLLFNEFSAIPLFLEAIRLEEAPIVDLMLQRISRVFLTFVATSDFLNLTYQELYPIINSTYICVNFELDVLLSVVRWLMHDWDNRKVYDEVIMNLIRFGLIMPQTLVLLAQDIHFPEVMEIMRNPAVDNMRMEGLTYSVYRFWPVNTERERYEGMRELISEQPKPRYFYKRTISYYNSYHQFLLYLERIRNSTIEHATLMNNLVFHPQANTGDDLSRSLASAIHSMPSNEEAHPSSPGLSGLGTVALHFSPSDTRSAPPCLMSARGEGSHFHEAFYVDPDHSGHCTPTGARSPSHAQTTTLELVEYKRRQPHGQIGDTNQPPSMGHSSKDPDAVGKRPASAYFRPFVPHSDDSDDGDEEPAKDADRKEK